jgi:hypothetical protein
MSNHRDIRHDLEPDLEAGERRALLRMAERLQDERPLPSASFRGDLGRQLAMTRDRRPAAPTRLRTAIATYVSSGSLLMAIAALGVAGAGPFAA